MTTTKSQPTLKSAEGSGLPGTADISAEWRGYADQLDWGPGSRDESGYRAFLRAGSLGIDPDIAVKEVTSRIKAGGGSFNLSKIQSQLRRAYEYAGSVAGALNTLARPPQTEFSPEKLSQVASAAPYADETWLARRSSIDPSTVTSRQFLKALYMTGEKIVVFSLFESQGQCLFEVGGEPPSPLPVGGPEGVWFLSNPVDGDFHPNPRQENKPSRRSEESVTSWRYLVLESDNAPADEWIRALAQVPLKIAAIYTSGGKSIHALVRLDAASKSDWDKQRDIMKPIMVTLGADPSAMTAVRLTRLPGTMRGENPQCLLYLNPNPTGKPIVAACD